MQTTEDQLSIALTGTGALKNANQKPTAPQKPRIIQPVLLRARQQPAMLIKTDFDIVKELADLKQSTRCKTESQFQQSKRQNEDLTNRLLKRSQSLSNKLIGGRSNKSNNLNNHIASKNKENDVVVQEKQNESALTKLERSPYRESRTLDKPTPFQRKSNERHSFDNSRAQKSNNVKPEKLVCNGSERNERKAQGAKSTDSSIKPRSKLPQIPKPTSITTPVNLQTVKEQLEREKEAKKAQQRSEIYALNREMRNLENEMFEAFMASNSFPTNLTTAAPLPNLKNSSDKNSKGFKTDISEAGRV